MDERDRLAERFEEQRNHLHAVAYRMLGSSSEAEDAVQEAWLRLSRTGGAEVENLAGWLRTVVARVCLDMLRSRTTRREEPLAEHAAEKIAGGADDADPEHEALLADSVGVALLVVLDTLAPAERLAFVLHDMFAVPFEEIAPIVGRSAVATRQLASRARRRVQGATTVSDADVTRTAADPDLTRRRAIVDAFLNASRNGDFAGLVALLDPAVVLRADAAAVLTGATPEVRGAPAVAQTFSGRARAARRALVNGAPGAVWAPGGQPRVVFAFTLANEKIAEIQLLADPTYLRDLDLVILDD
jgi:RNA polymerase sigma-70 factor (ECF subfamily)